MPCNKRETGIARQLLAKFVQISCKLTGVTIPTSAEKRWCHVINRILDPFVEAPAEFTNSLGTSCPTSALCHGALEVFHHRPDRHAAQIADFLSSFSGAERPKLHEWPFQDRVFLFEEPPFTHNACSLQK